MNLALSAGTMITEPMAFGLGRGLSFIFWHSKKMPTPFLGGRIQPDQIIRNAAAALEIGLNEEQTSSSRKAEASLRHHLAEGRVVALKLDRFYLEYTNEHHHFPAHYVACLSCSDEDVVVVETEPLGIKSTSTASVARARAATGAMSSRHLAFTIASQDDHPVVPTRDSCRSAIHRTATDFLNPTFGNSGHKGIAKAAGRITSWAETLEDPVATAHRVGVFMERGGTGGGMFRSLWADFLREAHALCQNRAYLQAATQYDELASTWTSLADLLMHATRASIVHDLERGGAMLAELGRQEKETMAMLATATQ